jgi:G3E family GTPase
MMLTFDEKQVLLDEAVQSVKFVEDVAAMVDLSALAEHLQSTFYNLEVGGLQRINENDFICINKEDLTEEQLKMSPYASCFVHEPKISTFTPAPKEQQ